MFYKKKVKNSNMLLNKDLSDQAIEEIWSFYSVLLSRTIQHNIY